MGLLLGFWEKVLTTRLAKLTELKPNIAGDLPLGEEDLLENESNTEESRREGKERDRERERERE
jgi:hypothetical protein